MIVYKDTEYKYNQAILKSYDDKKYKLVNFKVLRTPDLDIIYSYSEKGSVNDAKLENNIIRAKSTIYELALCNDWAWWCTFTLNKQKYDRYDLDKFKKDFSQYLRDKNKKYNSNIKYLLVPEQHQDGAWHMHGLMVDIPPVELVKFNEGNNIPKYIKKRLKEGQAVYNWPSYVDKFGWCDLEYIKNKDACAKYITKYINKSLERTVSELNAHSYYCSQGLKRAVEIKRGTMLGHIDPDFENDYVRVKWFNKGTDIKSLLSLIE